MPHFLKTSLKSATLALGVLGLLTPTPLAACSYVDQDKNGVYTVTDCWCKTCTTWTTDNRDLIAKWMKNAIDDKELC